MTPPIKPLPVPVDFEYDTFQRRRGSVVAPTFDRLPINNLTAAYHAWVEHYNHCETCQHEDWMSPTLGEAYLCTDGRPLFRAWVHMARITPPSTAEGRRRGRHT